MPTYNAVFAAIHVDDRPLDEYQVQQDDASKEVSCWIPAQVGKNFTISYKNLSLNKHMALKVLVDGHEASCIHLSPQCRGTVRACRISSTQERPFLFSEGKLVDDDDIQGEIASLDKLGTITLSFQEGHSNGTTIKTPGDIYKSTFGHVVPEQRQIPERKKKGIQTCVALGPIRVISPARTVDFTYTNNITHMIFRYRPLDYLQAQGIAPPPPPPPQPQSASRPARSVTTANKNKRKRVDDVASQAGPSKAKRTQTGRKLADIEISDDEDIEKLQVLRSRIDKMLAKKNARIKKEIKTEQTAAFSEGEVIDLT